MKGLILILILLAVGAFFTKPDREAHMLAYGKEAEKACAQGGPAAAALCGGAATAVANLATYEDRYLYTGSSLGNAHAIGIFGQVFVMQKGQ